MQHDLIIKNGNIIDGTGSDAYSGDIAIKDGLITEIGEVNGEAAEIIDAEGMTVSLALLISILTWMPKLAGILK